MKKVKNVRSNVEPQLLEKGVTTTYVRSNVVKTTEQDKFSEETHDVYTYDEIQYSNEEYYPCVAVQLQKQHEIDAAQIADLQDALISIVMGE